MFISIVQVTCLRHTESLFNKLLYYCTEINSKLIVIDYSKAAQDTLTKMIK